MALKDIGRETPKEFVKNSAKLYIKEVIRGAFILAIIFVLMFLYRTNSGGDLSGPGQVAESAEMHGRTVHGSDPG